MKKVILSSLMLLVAAMISAATYSWEKVVTVTLTDGNNDTYSSRFGAAPELTDAASWGAVTTNLTEAVTVRAYTTLGGVNYEQLYLNSIENLPLTIKTFNSETMTITLTALYGEIKLYDNGALVLTVKKGSSVESDSYVFSVAKNETIEGRFVINYQAPAPTCDYSRNNLVVGKYYTICLPKAVENPTGASFWNLRYRNSEGTLAYLEEATGALVAGRPYIFQAEATELCFEYNSGDDVPAGAYGALVGTITGMEQDALTAAGAHIYLLKNNELWFVSGQSGNVLPEKRAYVNYDNFVEGTPNAAPGRRVRAIPMQTNGTTGLENLNVSEAPAKMIIDGKMYILRGEQMFDATGRLVK